MLNYIFTKKSKRTEKPKEPVLINKKKTKEQLLKILSEIEEKKGYVKPHDLVNQARSKSSPIHNLFEWDNEKAGEAYRIEQARSIIQRVKVEIVGEKTHAYYSARVQINDIPVRGYFSAERIMTEEELYVSVLQDAIRELKYWQKKYKNIKEIKGIIDSNKIELIESSFKV